MRYTRVHAHAHAHIRGCTSGRRDRQEAMPDSFQRFGSVPTLTHSWARSRDRARFSAAARLNASLLCPPLHRI